MRLTNARITNFKSIDDSDDVEFNDVTCMVGKNESGKTAFLQALQKINPVSPIDGNLNILDYPRKAYTKYKAVHEEHPATAVATQCFIDQEHRASDSVDHTKSFASRALVYLSDICRLILRIPSVTPGRSFSQSGIVSQRVSFGDCALKFHQQPFSP